MNRNYTKQNPNFLIQSNESTLKFIRFNLSFLTTCGLVVCARYDLAYASCIFKNQDPSFSKTKWQPPLLRQSGSLSLIFRKKKKKSLHGLCFPVFLPSCIFTPNWNATFGIASFCSLYVVHSPYVSKSHRCRRP